LLKRRASSETIPGVLAALSVLALGIAVSSGRSAGAGPGPPAASGAPEARAIAYLGREVPRWSRENRCFSCHHNGDAARALIDASRRKLAVPAGALDDTAAFLAHPERWDKNGVDAAFSDKRLARLQFATALAAAVPAGLAGDRAVLVRAAALVAADQSPDGSWPIDDAALIGSPAAYGRPLATALARQLLAGADPERFASAVATPLDNRMGDDGAACQRPLRRRPDI
jgi:hypothetical protein